MKVNYNVSAMVANNALQRNDKLLSESLGRLSSGLKITNAKDNPSGLAMSRRMNSQIEGLGVANNTSKDAISIVQVADGSLSEIHEVLQRMSELAVQASNGTLTDSDREAIQSEVTLLKEEIERMAQTTQFNGQTILDGSFDYRGYATVGNDPSTAETNPNVKMVSYSDVVEAGTHVLYVIEQQASFICDPEHYVQNTFLGVSQAEDTGEKLRPHLGDSTPHRVALLTEHVIETYRAALELGILDPELGHSLLDESAGSSGLGYSGKVAFHVRHEAGDTGLAKALGHDLECDGLAGTGRTSHKSVPVRHLPDNRERPVFAVGYPKPVVRVVHI